MKLFLRLLIIGLTLLPSIAMARGLNLLPQELPPLDLLEDAALRRSGLDPALVQRWQKKTRLAAALPQLQIGFENKDTVQNTNIIQDSISVSSSGVSVGPDNSRVDQDIGLNRGFEFKAIWSLNELLFNQDELYVSREARDLTVVRGALLQEMNQLYFELKSHLVKIQLDPRYASDPFANLRTEQLVERLNTMSGGELKRKLGLSPSAPKEKNHGAKLSKK